MILLSTGYFSHFYQERYLLDDLKGLGSNVFFVTFWLYLNLNKQKIIKKIAFLVKMAKMANSQNFQWLCGEVRIKKKSKQKF
jgi:hypothetical protein